MAIRYRFVKRSTIIIYFEAVIFSTLVSYFLWKQLDFHWGLLLIVFAVITGLFLRAFFSFAVFRYCTTILFSMVYGLLAYEIGRKIQADGVTVQIVFAFCAYFLSLSMHQDDFNFIKKAEIIEYE